MPIEGKFPHFKFCSPQLARRKRDNVSTVSVRATIGDWLEAAIGALLNAAINDLLEVAIDDSLVVAIVNSPEMVIDEISPLGKLPILPSDEVQISPSDKLPILPLDEVSIMPSDEVPITPLDCWRSNKLGRRKRGKKGTKSYMCLKDKWVIRDMEK